MSLQEYRQRILGNDSSELDDMITKMIQYEIFLSTQNMNNEEYIPFIEKIQKENYIPKFWYPQITQVNDPNGRYYTINNLPHKIPSVTTILSKTKDSEKLDEWKQRVGEDEAKRITKESCDIGTQFHNNIEKYIKFKNVFDETSNDEYMKNIIKTARTMANSLIVSGLNLHLSDVWAIEEYMFYPYLWAGTSDCVGIYDGKPSIIDFKNSRKMKKREWIDDYFCQLSAYRLAHNHLFDTKIEQGVILMVDRNNQFKSFIIEKNEFDQYNDKWLRRVEQYYQK